MAQRQMYFRMREPQSGIDSAQDIPDLIAGRLWEPALRNSVQLPIQKGRVYDETRIIDGCGD